jgi:glycosyltransferase involved in cell wall biosynthesis
MPIYKVEDYLEDSIRSVLNQDFKDFELILVDDGSPDRCPKICDDFASSDDKVFVVHKPNGGLSDARNAGLSVAKGKYIIFLDSDDLMVEGALDHIYEQLTKSENIQLLIGNLTYYIDNKPVGKISYPDTLINCSTNDIYKTCTTFVQEIYRLPWAAYQCVYEREYLNRNSYIYDKNIVGAEDCEFFMKILPTIERYSITDYSFVYYRKNRAGSIMTKQSLAIILGQLNVLSKCYYDLKNIGRDTKILQEYFANRYANIIVLISRLETREDINQCSDVIKHHLNILKNAKGKKYIIAKLFWKLFGFYQGSKILCWLRKSVEVSQ